MEAGLSVETLRREAKSIRANYDETDVVGQCDNICYELLDNLVSAHGIPRDALCVEQRRVGSQGQENHYILVVSDHVETHETVWVDLSLDQFCETNAEAGLVGVSLGAASEIDSVRVMCEDDEKRAVYMSVRRYFEMKFQDIY